MASRHRPKHKPAKQLPRAGTSGTRNPTTERPPPQQPTWWKRAVALNVLGILAVAVVLRVIKLDNIPGVNGDEAWMGVQAMAALQRDLQFSWRTPTGNPLNLFLFLPELALHALWRPSFGLLRAPAVASGLAALVASFWLCRKVFGPRTAWLLTILLAVLPVNIAYSRFAWDSCQTLLATTCAIFPALLAVIQPDRRVRWLLWSGLGFAASLLVHPTNIFIAPLLATVAVGSWRGELRQWWRDRLGNSAKNALLVAGIVGAAGLGLVLMSWESASPGLSARLQSVRANASSAASVLTFVKYYPRLFSGVTVYQYLAGSCADQASLETLARLRAEPYATRYAIQPDVIGYQVHDLAAILLFLVAGGALLHRIHRERSPIDVCLVVGCALTALGFYLVAGSVAIMPHLERYAICLVAPTALLMARAADWLIPGAAGTARAALTGLFAVAWLWLASFYINYYAFIERTGDESHMTFRTASVEPKAAVLQHIQSQRQHGSPAWIVSQEWWSFYPLEYLASADRELHNVRAEGVVSSPPAELQAALRDGRVWCVEFLESAYYPLLSRWYAEQAGRPIEETIVDDFANRPLLSIMHAGPLRQESSQDDD